MAGVGVELGIYDMEKGLMPTLDGFGWNGRIARGTYEFLLSASQEQLENTGVKKKMAMQILDQKDRLLESWKDKGPWKIMKGIGPDSWRRILQQSIAQQSVKIDTVVTTDVHRLIRLSNTLHGETGLKKVVFAAGEIERFDPLKSAIAFTEGTIRVEVAETPEFRLGDTLYGPFNNRKIELPSAAAMFLLCKGVANALEEPVVVQ
jgi:DNA primase small subunit